MERLEKALLHEEFLIDELRQEKYPMTVWHVKGGAEFEVYIPKTMLDAHRNRLERQLKRERDVVAITFIRMHEDGLKQAGVTLPQPVH
jgi:hypothetical protein